MFHCDQSKNKDCRCYPAAINRIIPSMKGSEIHGNMRTLWHWKCDVHFKLKTNNFSFVHIHNIQFSWVDVSLLNFVQNTTAMLSCSVQHLRMMRLLSTEEIAVYK